MNNIEELLKNININIEILTDLYARGWSGLKLKDIKIPTKTKTRSYGTFKY